MAKVTTQSGTPQPATQTVRRKGGVSSAAALIPLAIGLGSMANLPKVPSTASTESAPVTSAANAVPVVCSSVEDEEDCHSRYPAGCNGNGKYDATLAFLKDLTDFPSRPQAFLQKKDFMNKEAALPATLKNNNHSDLVPQLAAMGEGQVFATVGFLYAIKSEGKETCNCELDSPDAIDYHMYIGYDPARAAAIAAGAKAGLPDEGDAVIVEMTPQYRARFHPEWEFATLQKVVGKQVRVTGQLLADNEHFAKGQDCALGATATCFRATIWELHPVTAFQFCPANDCTATTGTWSEIGQSAQ